MLAQRVAGIIGVLVQQAQRTEASDAVATEPDREDYLEDEEAARASNKPRLLDLQRREYGAMPHEAAITTTQAESALNHNAATEHGEEDDGNVPDNDVIAEMEALAGLDLNPPMLDYSCHAVELEQCTKSDLKDLGWPEMLPLRQLDADAFQLTADDAREVLQKSVGQLRQDFAAQCINSTATERLQQLLSQLDPTQSMVHAWVKRWLGERGSWKLGMLAPAQNHQLLLLGTAYGQDDHRESSS